MDSGERPNREKLTDQDLAKIATQISLGAKSGEFDFDSKHVEWELKTWKWNYTKRV